jgi:ATP/ADP translocase
VKFGTIQPMNRNKFNILKLYSILISVFVTLACLCYGAKAADNKIVAKKNLLRKESQKNKKHKVGKKKKSICASRPYPKVLKKDRQY